MVVFLNKTEVAHYYSMTCVTGWKIKPDENKVSVTLKVSGYDDQINTLTAIVEDSKQSLVSIQSSVTALESKLEKAGQAVSRIETLSTQVNECEKTIATINTQQYSAMMNLIAADAQTFSDEKAFTYKDLYEDWQTSVVYPVGYKVNYNGILYKCLQAHTSQSSWTPDTAHSLWAKVLIPDSSVVLDWEQPLSTNGYKKGDKIKHNEKTWESLVDNNVWEPGAVGTHAVWKEVTA